MNRDAIDLSKASVFSLFSKYFFPTLFAISLDTPAADMAVEGFPILRPVSCFSC